MKSFCSYITVQQQTFFEVILRTFFFTLNKKMGDTSV